MAVRLHSSAPMLDVSSFAPSASRRVAFLCWALLILVPASALAQAPTVAASWSPSPLTDLVIRYEVCIGTASMSCDLQLASVLIPQTSLRFAPSPGVLHYVAVRAVNLLGRGAYSTEASFSIPAITPPTNRTSATSTAITPFTIAVQDPDGSSLTFTHTGLPLGLSLSQTTGRISGTPTAPGTYNVTVFVDDGLVTTSSSFVWTITSGATADTTPPALAVTSHTSGVAVTSTSVTIRGTATDSGRGGSGIAAVRVNGQSATGGTASSANTANWSRALTLSSGSNTITVEAYDGAGNIQMQQLTLPVAVPSPTPTPAPASGPLRITGLTSNRTSPQAAGTSITFTASATGGRAPYQFKWWIFDGANWIMARDWTTANTYAWTPTRAGAGYRVGIWLRDSTTTADVSSVNLSVPFVVSGGGAAPAPAPTPAPPASPSVTSPLTVTGLTSSRVSPQAAGTSITFTAGASGGRSPYQYKWWLFDGSTWIMVRDWTTSNTYTWTPTRAGTGYYIGIWVRDSTTTADVNTVNYSVPFAISGTVSAPAPAPSPSPGTPLSILGLTSNRVSPQAAGTSITFTASATGGRSPYQYKWWLYDGTTWTMIRDWNSSNTYTWTPTQAGTTYRIGIWARDATTAADVNNVNVSVPYVITGSTAVSSGPLRITGLSSSRTSPTQVGTAVTFTASVTGGRAPYQFKWWVFDGSTWSMVRDWTTSSTYTWTPAVEGGSYRVGIWVRDSTTQADTNAVNLSVPFQAD